MNDLWSVYSKSNHVQHCFSPRPVRDWFLRSTFNDSRWKHPSVNWWFLTTDSRLSADTPYNCSSQTRCPLLPPGRQAFSINRSSVPREPLPQNATWLYIRQSMAFGSWRGGVRQITSICFVPEWKIGENIATHAHIRNPWCQQSTIADCRQTL